MASQRLHCGVIEPMPDFFYCPEPLCDSLTEEKQDPDQMNERTEDKMDFLLGSVTGDD